MADTREAVLVRLVAIAEESGLFEVVVRNKKRPSDDKLPACMILDADEDTDDGDPPRSGVAPRRVAMMPEIYLIGRETVAEAVGPAINALRAAFLKAVLTDAAMIAILGPNGAMRYLGCATGLAEGRSMLAEMGVNIAFHYVLKPADLVA